MHVGRRRRNNTELKLEPRVYWKDGQWKYRRADGNPTWEPLGTDVEKANAIAKVYNDPEKRYGTFGHFIDLFIREAKAGRLHSKPKEGTIVDYDQSAVMLKAGLGKRLPRELIDNVCLISDYRDERSNPRDGSEGAPVRANRELSLGSTVFSWLIQTPHGQGLTVNPFEFVDRNPEEQKDKYVEDDHYRAVYGIAVRSACAAMTIVYKTLQRPSDILALPPSARRMKNVAGRSVRVLSIHQSKTGRTVDIEVTPDLDDALHMLTRGGQEFGRYRINSKTVGILPTIIHTEKFTPYTLTGIGAMIRRYCIAAGVDTFGLMDVRAKGATDMYLRETPLEKIQLLMGHASVKTTEIYIKRLLGTISIAAPNSVAVPAIGGGNKT